MADQGSFYVYKHIRPDTGECFYVGKGKGSRSYFFDRAESKHYMEVINDLGCNPLVEIVESGLTEEESFNLEKRLIRSYGRQDLGTGPLVNRTDGGEGLTGIRHTPEHKAYVSYYSKKYQANGGYTKGRPFPDWHKAKLREAIARRSPEEKERLRKLKSERMKGNKNTLGVKLTEEHRARISARMKANPPSSCFKKGHKPSLETRKKWSMQRRGVPKSLSHREKLAEHCRRIGRAPEAIERTKQRSKGNKYAAGWRWYNNGIEECRSLVSLGDGWGLGRLSRGRFAPKKYRNIQEGV